LLGLDARVGFSARMGLLSQLGHEARELGATRSPPGLDAARERLDLLDVDVRVEREV